MANYDPNYGRESEKFQKKFKLNIPPILSESENVVYEITSPFLTDTKADNTTFKNDPPYIKLVSVNLCFKFFILSIYVYLLLLYCSLCNVGLRPQNLSHLNKTHNENNENKNIYIQHKININKTPNMVKI